MILISFSLRMMQCYQSPATATSFNDTSFIVKDFNPARFVQSVPLSEVYQSESSKASCESTSESICSSSTSPGSANSSCISLETKESLRWTRIDSKLMHADVKKFLKRNGCDNSKMAANSSGQKSVLRNVFNRSIEEAETGDSDLIKLSLMQVVQPKM